MAKVIFPQAKPIYTTQCKRCDAVFEFEDYEIGILHDSYLIRCPACNYENIMRQKPTPRFIEQKLYKCPCKEWVFKVTEDDIIKSPKQGRRSYKCNGCKKTFPESKWEIK